MIQNKRLLYGIAAAAIVLEAIAAFLWLRRRNKQHKAAGRLEKVKEALQGAVAAAGDAAEAIVPDAVEESVARMSKKTRKRAKKLQKEVAAQTDVLLEKGRKRSMLHWRRD